MVFVTVEYSDGSSIEIDPEKVEGLRIKAVGKHDSYYRVEVITEANKYEIEADFTKKGAENFRDKFKAKMAQIDNPGTGPGTLKPTSFSLV